MGPLQQYLNGPQFKWAPKNNINPGGPGPFNLILPTNLNGFPAIKFKRAPNNNIDSRGPGSSIQFLPTNLNVLPE